ncbi:MAG: YhfC family glutamic-type intramembrane protease [Candidatus ainarchaeum sp.]|nr:YhfC family glutamic-type intramembrane protease [Candidatus ainarchaeum sp.]
MDSVFAAAVIISGLLAIIIPVFLAYKFSKSEKLPLKIALLGAGFFILVQVFRAPFVLLTQSFVYYLFAPLGDLAAKLALAFYLGLMAALFEELARYLIFAKIMKERTLESAKLFGLGWGGAESIIFLGILSTATYFVMEDFFATTDLSSYNQTLVSQGLTPEEAQQTIVQLQDQKLQFEQSNVLLPFLGLYERLLAMAFHLCASLLVMKSVMDKNFKGLLLALGAHFLLDFVAVVSLIPGNAIVGEAALTLVVAGIVVFTAKTLKMKGTEILSPS